MVQRWIGKAVSGFVGSRQVAKELVGMILVRATRFKQEAGRDSVGVQRG